MHSSVCSATRVLAVVLGCVALAGCPSPPVAGDADAASPNDADATVSDASDLVVPDTGGDATDTPVVAPWHFTEIGAAAGVSWTQHPLTAGNDVTLYDHGNGIAAGDFDGDGHDDLLLLSQCGPTGLFMGHGDGTFTDRSSLFSSINDGVRVAATYGDFDNDGDVDFYVSFTNRPNALLQQNADGTFTDVGPALGVGASGTFSGVAFVDVNRDGLLDLVVAGALDFTTDVLVPADAECPAYRQSHTTRELFSGTLPSEPPRLFINGGPSAGFHFTDESSARGMPAGGTDARGFGDVITSDFDRDGDPDLVLTEMFAGRTAILVNDGTGHFTDRAGTIAPQVSWGSPTGAVADFNNDGFDDFYIVDMHADMWINASQPFSTVHPGERYRGPMGPAAGVGDNATGPIYGNTLWLSQGSADRFVESDMAWHAETFQPWGTLAADFDNDGDLDVFIASGMSDPYDFWPNQFLENTGSGFVERQSDLGFDPPPDGRFDPSLRINGQPYVSAARCSASADFDEDGDLDLAVLVWNHRVNLFRNDLGPHGHYVDISLRGSAPRDPYGATVEIIAGGRTIVRSFDSSRGYLSQSSRWIHVGLGESTAIDRITARWPDHTTTVVMAPAIDHRIEIQQR